MIYLDNAATSFPKPADLLARGLERYLELGASPGRGGYDRAVEAEATVAAARKKLAGFFGAGETANVCFTANATDALNMLLQGLLGPGDHAISSRLEHNSVLRPLNGLRLQRGIDLDLVPFSTDGYVDPAAIASKIRPETRLVVLTHASNVLGTIQPISEIGALCRKNGIPLILDTAQTAGLIPIDMQAMQVSALAFTGHKSLLGPSGIGGLVLAPNLHPRSTRFGGTGFDSTNPLQPEDYPGRLEAGTINMLGILCLAETVELVAASMHGFYAREMQLYDHLADGLRQISRIRIFGLGDRRMHLPVLACTIDGIASTDVGAILDGDYGIAVRTGLHCAPLLHGDLGLAPGGTIRFSLGPWISERDIAVTLQAMREIAG